jgi:hypothetical protein
VSESLLLAVLGAAAGLVVAVGLAERFRGEQLVRLPAFEGLAPVARVLAFAVATALVAGLLAGAAPAFGAGRVQVTASLGEAGGRETARKAFARSTLTVVQIALSMALLVGAMLLTRTIRNLHAVDYGIDPSPIVTFNVYGSPVGYTPEESQANIRRLFEEVRAVPGVDAVAMDMYGPL